MVVVNHLLTGMILQASGRLLLTHPAVLQVAEETGKTAAQVLLRWALQQESWSLNGFGSNFLWPYVSIQILATENTTKTPPKCNVLDGKSCLFSEKSRVGEIL